MFKVKGTEFAEAITSLKSLIGDFNICHVRAANNLLTITTKGQNAGYVSIPCLSRTRVKFAVHTTLLTGVISSYGDLEFSLSEGQLFYKTSNGKFSGHTVVSGYEEIEVVPLAATGKEKFSADFLALVTEWLPYVGVAPSVMINRKKHNLQVSIKDGEATMVCGDTDRWAYLKCPTTIDKTISLDIPIEYIELMNSFGSRQVKMQVLDGILYVWNQSMGIALPSLQIEQSEISPKLIIDYIKGTRVTAQFDCNPSEIARVMYGSQAIADSVTPPVKVVLANGVLSMSAKSSVGSIKETLDIKNAKGKDTSRWDSNLCLDIFYRCGSKVTTIKVVPAGALIQPGIGKGATLIYGATAFQEEA